MVTAKMLSFSREKESLEGWLIRGRRAETDSFYNSNEEQTACVHLEYPCYSSPTGVVIAIV